MKYQVISQSSDGQLRDQYAVYLAVGQNNTLPDNQREGARQTVAAIEREAGRRWLKGETGEGESQ